MNKKRSAKRRDCAPSRIASGWVGVHVERSRIDRVRRIRLELDVRRVGFARRKDGCVIAGIGEVTRYTGIASRERRARAAWEKNKGAGRKGLRIENRG